MSHPIPGHEYGENESPDEGGYKTLHKKKSAVAKSMGRHGVKTAKSLRGVYPGSIGDTLAKIRQSIKKHKHG